MSKVVKFNLIASLLFSYSLLAQDNDNISKLKKNYTITKSKLYVAITRTKGNLYFIHPDMLNEYKIY